jgi:hypothetical protein
MSSGKPRAWLANNYVPKVFESVGLDLDDERRQFEYWFEFALIYGSLPFQIPRLLRPEEAGVCQFVPGTLSFDMPAPHTATFSLREIQ